MNISVEHACFNTSVRTSVLNINMMKKCLYIIMRSKGHHANSSFKGRGQHVNFYMKSIGAVSNIL